jgi:hypothetical protein
VKLLVHVPNVNRLQQLLAPQSQPALHVHLALKLQLHQQQKLQLKQHL